MSTPRSIEESLLDWRRMLDNLAPHLDEMPHLRPLHEAFEALLAEAGALQNERWLHASRLREVNRKRRDAHAAGRALRNRVVASLQERSGRRASSWSSSGSSRTRATPAGTGRPRTSRPSARGRPRRRPARRRRRARRRSAPGGPKIRRR